MITFELLMGFNKTFDDDIIENLYEENQSTYKTVLELLRRNNLIPFIGAGFSAGAYPTWGKLLTDMAKPYPTCKDEVNLNLKKGYFEEAASVLCHEMNHHTFLKKVHKIFGPDTLKEKYSRVTSERKLLPHIFTGNIVTTNFDKIVEDIYNRRLYSICPHTEYQESAVTKRLQNGSQSLMKLHGDIEDDTNIILTKEDYDRFYGENVIESNMPLANMLKIILQTKPILFLGCSLESDRVLNILSSCADNRDYFALVELPEDTQNINNPFTPLLVNPDGFENSKYRERRRFLADHHINCIWYPYGQYDALDVFLSHLNKELNPDLSLIQKKPSISPTRKNIGKDQETVEIYQKLQVENVNKNSTFNGDYFGNIENYNETKINNYNIILYSDKERQFIVSHESNIKPVEYFTGRETELKDLRQCIDEKRKCILLNGMGGIGKTQICRKLFDEYAKIGKEGCFDYIGYIEYNNDINSSLVKCLRFRKQDNPKQDNEAAWREIEYLSANGKMLLFIDNINQSIKEDPDLARLNTIPGAIVVTSRRNYLSKEFEPYQIGFLSIEDCIKIYERIRFEEEKRINADEIKDLKYIIEKLAVRHTITVQFLAHLSRVKHWSVKKLKNQLEEKGFCLEYHDENNELINIQRSYEILYDLSELTEAEQNILEAFSLFPYIPLKFDVCNQWLLEDAKVNEDDDIFTSLSNKGWLEFFEEEDGYAIHPVFSRFILDKVRPKSENHSGLLNACKNILEISDNGYVYEGRKFLMFIEIINQRIDIANVIEKATFEMLLAKLIEYIGEYAKAQKLYEKVLEISEEVLGEKHPDTATIYNNLAVVYERQGEYGKAQKLFEKALEICEEVLGEKHPSTAPIYNNLAEVYERQGEYGKAQKLFEKALEICEEVLGEKHPSTATIYNNLAEVYERQGEYGKAQKLFEKALEISEEVLGEKHPDTATSYNNLAGVYKSQGEYGKVQKLFEKALKISEEVLGEKHPDTATIYNNLAGVYICQGEYGKAQKLFEKALEIREEVLGEKHPSTATSYNNLAGVYESQGEYGKAQKLFEKALKIREKVLGEKHPSTAISYNNLAGVYERQGEYGKAQKLYEKALEICEEVLGEKHPSTATNYNNLAGVYIRQGEYGKAQKLYEKALEICEEVLGEKHPSTATSYNNLAGVYERQEEYGKAQKLYEKALEICEEVLGEKHPDTATSYNNLAGVYIRQGEYGKAQKLCEKALEISEEVLGEKHPDTATSYNNLAVVYKSQGEYGKAQKLFEKALEIREEVLGEKHPDTAISYNNLAVVYESQGEYGKAQKLFEKALEICEEVLGEKHPSTATSYNNLAGVYIRQGEYGKAQKLYGKALEICEEMLGEK